MNYQKLKALIITVTIASLIMSIIAFWWGYALVPLATRDLQGASGVASVLPAFAGVLIASVALYSYVKVEDPTLKVARDLTQDRLDLLAQLRAIGYQILQGNMVIRPQYLQVTLDSLIQTIDEDGSFSIDGVTIYKPKKEQEYLPNDHMQLLKRYAYEVVREKMVAYNKSVLNVAAPEISRLLFKLTPLVLMNISSTYGSAKPESQMPSRDELWLNGMSSIIKAMHVMSEDDDDADSLLNFANSIQHLIALLSNGNIASENKIYKILQSNNGKMNRLDSRLDDFCEALYNSIGKRPQIAPVNI